MKKGRPTKYTPEKATSICERVMAGETFRQICREEGIASASLLSWLHKDEAFMMQYARARELSAYTLETEALDDAREARDMTDVAKANNKLANIKWLAGKRAPKVFGDRSFEHLNLDNISLATETDAINAIRFVALAAAAGKVPLPQAKTMMMMFAGVVQAEQHKLEAQVNAALAKLKGVPQVEDKSKEKKE